MTYYQQEIAKIRDNLYSNQAQLDTVIATRHFIRKNFHLDMNLALISRTQCSSKFHLLRIFKKYYGQTPIQCLTENRLVHAKKLLISGQPVTLTCFDVGFESPASFSTLFKSRFGLSPAQFQKKQFSKSKVVEDSAIL